MTLAAPPRAWPRIAARLLALAALLGACLAAHGAWRAARRESPWPRRFLAAAARIAGARVRAVGAPAPPPVLLLANHLSWIDILALGGAAGSTFVAHDGLAAHPVLRALCRLNRTVFVARAERGAIADQAARLRAALGHKGVLALFPEGTTGDGTALLGFKSALLGAVEPAAARVAVQPVLLDYGARAPEIAWHGAERGVANFVRVLGERSPLPLTIRFLPPLAGAALGSRKAMAAAARAAIVDAMAMAADAR